jgi:hypothetical protein
MHGQLVTASDTGTDFGLFVVFPSLHVVDVFGLWLIHTAHLSCPLDCGLFRPLGIPLDFGFRLRGVRLATNALIMEPRVQVRSTLKLHLWL